jgi:hypothetical protein
VTSTPAIVRRRSAFLSNSLIALIALSRTAAAAAPSGCTDISAEPAHYNGVQYAAAIQGIFTNYNQLGNGCADCHTTSMGIQEAAGDLDLDPTEAPPPYENIFNKRAANDSSLFYVVPKHPERSLLFWKVSCTDPVSGGRMPSGGYPDGMTTLTTFQQALIWDWIAEGAPSGTTDGIFQGTFDLRGFKQ